MINYGFHARYYVRPEVTWYSAESNYDLARLFFFSFYIFSSSFHLSGSRFSLNFVGGVFIVRHLRCQALNVDDKQWRQVEKEYSKRHAENEIYRINLFCLFEKGGWRNDTEKCLFLQEKFTWTISYFTWKIYKIFNDLSFYNVLTNTQTWILSSYIWTWYLKINK